MGYCLLYESMLATVIYARDKWLKPGGLVLPDKFRMVVAGCTDAFRLKSEKELWWSNVFGIDMSCVGKNFYVEPLVENVPQQTIVTDTCVFKEIDLLTCTADAATFANEYQLTVIKGVSSSDASAKIDSLLVWFDFAFDTGLESKVELSTGPFARLETHWKQTMFWIDGEYHLMVGDKL
jgi:type I protein arginine methyltransferase